MSTTATDDVRTRGSGMPPESRTLYLGVDEAGYGPNLGPLVVACVGIIGPSSWTDRDWWERLAPGVVRSAAADGLVVDDSKKVFSGPNGRRKLDRTVHAFLQVIGCHSLELEQLFERLDAEATDPLRGEHWFPPRSGMPTEFESDIDAHALRELLRSSRLELESIRCRVLFPGEFNSRLNPASNKADLESRVVVELLRHHLANEQRIERDVVVAVDRLGARRYYRTLVEDLTAGVFVRTLHEGPRASRYDYAVGGRAVTIDFRVDADRDCLVVALASMVAKYLRERCMAEFNAFWRSVQPGVRPTAGYPTDARRYLKDVRPQLDRLRIPLREFWRAK